MGKGPGQQSAGIAPNGGLEADKTREFDASLAGRGMTGRLMKARLVWVSLGANLGDRTSNVLKGAQRLGALGPLRLSSLYETAPWGKTDQPWFVNAVAELSTALAAADLHRHLQGIEEELGRVHNERWGPRTIDLDYLLDEDGPVAGLDLIVPHRELENRAFVLAPLLELRPALVLPSGRLAAARLSELRADQPLRRLEAPHTIAPCPPPT